jgi:hypothetical protein
LAPLPTTVPEIKKQTIEDYWSTDPTIATRLSNETIMCEGAELILKFWHYCNKEELPENERLSRCMTFATF